MIDPEGGAAEKPVGGERATNHARPAASPSLASKWARSIARLASNRRWDIWAGVGLGLVLAGVVLWLFWPEEPSKPFTSPPPAPAAAPSAPLDEETSSSIPPYEEKASTFQRHLALVDAAIMDALAQAGLEESDFSFLRVRNVVQDDLHYDQVEIGLNLKETTPDQIESALLSALSRLDFLASLTGREEALEVWLDGRLTHSLLLEVPPRPAPPAAEAAVLAAIIIDDLGYHPQGDQDFLSVDLDLTLSILPFSRQGEALGRAAAAQGREVMLHLPMEPKGYPQVNPGPGALLGSMDRSQLEDTLAEDLSWLPWAKGANNHMGSRLTEDAERLEIILGELKARGMYFIDSRTTPFSRVMEVAARLGLPAAQRSIFLDNVPEPQAIKAQLGRLVARAREEGRAVAIGHPHPQTRRVLIEAAQELETQIQVVPASRLVE